MEIRFPALKASDVEVRVSQCSEKGAALLLYKDARVDMRMLDDAVGAPNWQRRHDFKEGKLYCSVGILCDGEWVWKEDVGTPSNMEADKGAASDAFKRACFNWGIGRELYTAPRIWVPAGMCNVRQGNNGRWQCYDRFAVQDLAVEDGTIAGVSIVNGSKGGMQVFAFGCAGAEDVPDEVNEVAALWQRAIERGTRKEALKGWFDTYMGEGRKLRDLSGDELANVREYLEGILASHEQLREA